MLRLNFSDDGQGGANDSEGTSPCIFLRIATPTIACATAQASGLFTGPVPRLTPVTLGTAFGVTPFTYTVTGPACRFVVMFEGVNVLDTGYVTGSSSVSFTTDHVIPLGYVFVYAPDPASVWQFTLGCPGGASYSPSLDFSDERNSQYIPVVVF